MSIQIRPSVQMDPPQGPETIAAEHSPQSSTDPARQPAEDGHQTHPVPPSTPPSAAHSQPVSTPQDEKTLPPMAPPSTRRPSTASLSNLGNRRTLSFRGIRRTSNASSMKPLALLDHVTYERSMKGSSFIYVHTIAVCITWLYRMIKCSSSDMILLPFRLLSSSLVIYLAMSSWTLLMKSWANDCSVGLYRIVEHVDRRVPRMAADKVRSDIYTVKLYVIYTNTSTCK